MSEPWIEFLSIDRRELPSMAGTRSGKLLVVGSGRCVWDDLKGFPIRRYDVMALNDMIMHFPGPLDHVYSDDRKRLPKWIAARRPRYVMLEDTFIGHTVRRCADPSIVCWPFVQHGTSAQNAAFVGLLLGYEQIVLAGCPLDDSGHYFDPPFPLDTPWTEVGSNFTETIPDNNRGHPILWFKSYHYAFDGRVKSLSGRTRELLGAPEGVDGARES